MIGFINGWFKTQFKNIINYLGYDLISQKKNPGYTWLGLPKLGIKTIIDIGANRGQFISEAVHFFSAENIYCFEPLSDPFKTLLLLKKKIHQLNCFNLALGEKSGEIEMNLHVDHPSSSSLLQTTQTAHKIYPFTQKQVKEKVRMMSLDEFYRKNKQTMILKKQVLLKIDVQGYELSVLKGAKKILSSIKACLVEINISPLYQGQSSVYEIFNFFKNTGFQYAGNLSQSYSGHGQAVFIDALFIK